jgi:hypothetical protein
MNKNRYSWTTRKKKKRNTRKKPNPKFSKSPTNKTSTPIKILMTFTINLPNIHKNKPNNIAPISNNLHLNHKIKNNRALNPRIQVKKINSHNSIN